MITLFGATGYTGRLIAAELARMALPGGGLRLAGRSEEALKRLAGNLPNRTRWVRADVNDPKSIRALCEGSRVLVNCVGPFTDMGERVAGQAALHGVHYLDTTNELGYVHKLKGYDHLARQNGAAIVPACAFEVALADCMAAQMAAQAEGEIRRVDVTYLLGGSSSSPGTRRSAIRSLGTSWLGYRGGEWVAELPCKETRWVEMPKGRRRAISFPSSEIATVPKHLALEGVGTWMVVSRRSSRAIRTMMPFFAVLARTGLGHLMAELSVRLMPPPAQGLREGAKSVVLVEMADEKGVQRGILTGSGGYALTGKIAAYAARQMLEEDYDRAGVLAPAQALDVDAFLRAAVEDWGVKLTYERMAADE